MITPNPYNCTLPGNLFVGYDQMLEELCSGFYNGNSFAIIAGRRCGKTSLLQRIKEELLNRELPPFKPISCYLDIQGISKVTPAFLFETIFNLIANKLEINQYHCGDTGREYEAFLQQMDKIQPMLDDKYGQDWLVILLVDELDAAIKALPDDQFFQNLRNLLMISRFHRHFRLVATGVKEMADLISSGSSPLNNLRSKYLGILTINQARKLINLGITKNIDPEIESLLFQLTGRHPYLLQGLLEKIFLVNSPITKQVLINATKDFLKEHKDFSRWSAAFGPTEHIVYKYLIDRGGKLQIAEIRDKIDSDLIYGIDDALTVLSYHGVVDDSDPEELKIAGTLFQDWYLKNVSDILAESELSSKPIKRPSLTDIRNRVFISYSHDDDKKWLEKVQVHLQALENEGTPVNLWDDTKIKAGKKWRDEIEKGLRSTKIAILLVSTNFLASDFISKDELPPLLKAAKKDGATILPLILKPCRYSSHKKLSEFQAVNDPKKEPLSKLTEDEQDEILVKLTDRIAELMNENTVS